MGQAKLKARIVEPEKTSTARKRHGKTCLGSNEQLSNNKGIVVSGVFYAVRAEAI
jgi:hypothetical protein